MILYVDARSLSAQYTVNLTIVKDLDKIDAIIVRCCTLLLAQTQLIALSLSLSHASLQIARHSIQSISG